MYAIKTLNITKRFGNKVVLKDLTFQVTAGSCFGFLGLNGAGKSTTINILTGRIRPDSGRFDILGFDNLKDLVEIKKSMGVLSSESDFYEFLTCQEYLWLIGKLYNLDNKVTKNRVEELINFFDLLPNKDTLLSRCSTGTRKKVGLASALIHNPKILFLDEPFESVDILITHRIKELFKILSKKGTTIFISSHIIEVIENLCDDVAVIHNGSLVTQGRIEILKNSSGKARSLEDSIINMIGGSQKVENLSWI